MFDNDGEALVAARDFSDALLAWRRSHGKGGALIAIAPRKNAWHGAVAALLACANAAVFGFALIPVLARI